MEQHGGFLFSAFVGQAKPQVLLGLLSDSFFHWKLQFLPLVYLGQITAVPRPAGMPDGKCFQTGWAHRAHLQLAGMW